MCDEKTFWWHFCLRWQLFCAGHLAMKTNCEKKGHKVEQILMRTKIIKKLSWIFYFEKNNFLTQTFFLWKQFSDAKTLLIKFFCWQKNIIINIVMK